MPWWGWLLVAWLTLTTAVAFWLGAAARIARQRERAARRYRYAQATRPRVPTPRGAG